MIVFAAKEFLLRHPFSGFLVTRQVLGQEWVDVYTHPDVEEREALELLEIIHVHHIPVHWKMHWRIVHKVP